MKLGNQQQEAFNKIMAWYKGEDRIFTLGGYAGTGKTTLAKYISNGIGDKIFFCAYTGKAALNLREKGMKGASTIHRLIYTKEETENGFKWALNRKSRAYKADLIIVDEYSMLSEQIMCNLMEVTKGKILCLGDPAQLPPVEGKSILEPDFMLTQVHRQAFESPVLRAATYIRENGIYPKQTEKNDYGCFAVVNGDQLPLTLYEKFDQIIVNTNAKRQELNHAMRKAVLPNIKNNPYPVKNDKVICLQNDYDSDIYNGQIGKMNDVELTKRKNQAKATINFKERDVDLHINIDAMLGNPINQKSQNISFDNHKYVNFDYGYAITCHKAQGSEWDNVGIYPGTWLKKDWLYTAVTRARKNCAIFI
jgi:exodeoxyribonuclease-5